MASGPERPRIPRSIGVGIAAATFYVLVAAVVANLLDPIAGGDDTLDFVIATWFPVALLIVIGLLFTRRAGWTREAWTVPPRSSQRRHRWWLATRP